MSDISDLVGVFPNSIRWNAETGCLAYSSFDAESGERNSVEIELGPAATFALDLATRERGYGKIAVGFYDLRLTPVGSPPPPYPGEDYKAAIGCWLWCPSLGEVRFESCAQLLVRIVNDLWDRCSHAEQVAEGEQPVIRFVDRRSVKVQPVNKVFLVPVIEIVGSVPRDRIPGWAARAPTVLPPAPLPLLGGDVDPASTPKSPRTVSPRTVPRTAPRRGPARRTPTNKTPPKEGPSEAPFFDDDIPENLKK